jgi:Secretion system C-terminal sorting domain
MRFRFLFLAVVVAMASITSLAQRTATQYILNPQVSGGNYSFEIWSQKTNVGAPTVLVGITTFYFDLNNSGGFDFSTAPVLSNKNSKYDGPSDHSGDYDPISAIYVGSSPKKLVVTISFTGNNTGAGSSLVTTGPNGERICTVALKILSTTMTAQLTWDLANSDMTTSNLQPLTNTFNGSDNSLLPVELTSFTGTVRGTNVSLTWKTATEVNSSAFQIERRTASDWKKIGELKAAGTSNAPREYSYVDDMENIGSGNILYRLKTVDNNGSYKYSAEVEVTAIPQAYELKTNFPNPFNPETKIQYALPGNAKVRLVVYDIIGRQVAELVNEEQNAGYYEKTFSGSNLSSGLYFYRITAQAQGKNVFSQVKKMLLVK